MMGVGFGGGGDEEQTNMLGSGGNKGWVKQRRSVQSQAPSAPCGATHLVPHLLKGTERVVSNTSTRDSRIVNDDCKTLGDRFGGHGEWPR